EELPELGFVGFEQSKEQREQQDPTPLVELLIDTKSPADDDPKAQKTQAERDAKQVAQRILALTGNADGSGVQFRDIALLFRAMTDVPAYEAIFRAANIPFQTVQGKGFYQREEISDLVQLLRFLDNKTDEIALAAVLRSPLGGISDNALLALRCAPRLDEVDEENELRHFSQPRKLLYALRRHNEIASISAEEHTQLECAGDLLRKLIERRNHYPIADLLRFAVDESEYMTVIAANFDGAQKLANVRKLFTLAERFEHAGAHLVRDFVRYVEEFEAIGSREGEGQIDDSANAVRLMTIHQAKGLEFKVVIIPNLHHRTLKPQEHWYALDRHRGLTVKIPDGRGKQVAGCTLESFRERNRQREHFESVRLLYVAATRAKDRLILAGVTDALAKLSGSADNWLKLIWQKLELQVSRSGTVDLSPDTQLEVMLNLADELLPQAEPVPPSIHTAVVEPNCAEKADVASLSNAFPLLQRVAPEQGTQAGRLHRFSVTQLINYQRCPRQYYFDRVLHVPTPDQMAAWNDAEAPEPPANLNATLKGAVIHRFCETYSAKDDVETLLRQSFDEVVLSRQAQLADRLVEINADEALAELLPLEHNYLNSAVFERVERARSEPPASAGGSGKPPALAGGSNKPSALPGGSSRPRGEVGLWSELSFRLRRPLAILTGAIDKLLITPSADGKGLDVEIIDFKTNRLRGRSSASTSSLGPRAPRGPSEEVEQIAFDFNAPVARTEAVRAVDFSVEDQVRIAASDYLLQMQAYALAVSELMPSLSLAGSSIRCTLHFLEPAIEFHIDSQLLSHAACMSAIDETMMSIVSSVAPGEFLFRPAAHCRMCNFLGICPAGREWVRSARNKAGGSEHSLGESTDDHPKAVEAGR
ncbi:MAG: 3'-5' exonuclease, partial [bacterium]